MNQPSSQQITRLDKEQTTVSTGGAMTYTEGQTALSHSIPTGLKTSRITFWEDSCVNSFPTTKRASFTVTCMSF